MVVPSAAAMAGNSAAIAHNSNEKKGDRRRRRQAKDKPESPTSYPPGRVGLVRQATHRVFGNDVLPHQLKVPLPLDHNSRGMRPLCGARCLFVRFA